SRLCAPEVSPCCGRGDRRKEVEIVMREWTEWPRSDDKQREQLPFMQERVSRLAAQELELPTSRVWRDRRGELRPRRNGSTNAAVDRSRVPPSRRVGRSGQQRLPDAQRFHQRTS